MIQLNDAVQLSDVRRTGNGYMVASARVARTGIQVYRGSEVGKPERETVRLYRPESSVFDEQSLRSYAHKPMTNNHPHEDVTSNNWRSLSIGAIGGEIVRDGEFVRVPLIMMDAGAIAAYEHGKRELSMGYSADIKFVDGVTEDGQPYDAIMGPPIINHIALVDVARGGPELRIGDNHSGGQTMATKQVMVDGLTIETTEQGAQVIEKLQKQLSDSGNAATKAADAHAKEIALKDSELAKKDAEIDALKAAKLSDADIDARVVARADLIAKARSISDQDYSGKSDADIRKAAVVAKLGDAAIAGKADAYVEARFDLLLEDSAKDPVQRHFASHTSTQGVHDNGQSVYESGLTEAWKGNQK